MNWLIIESEQLWLVCLKLAQDFEKLLTACNYQLTLFSRHVQICPAYVKQNVEIKTANDIKLCLMLAVYTLPDPV